jgi:hypothetical protein
VTGARRGPPVSDPTPSRDFDEPIRTVADALEPTAAITDRPDSVHNRKSVE